MYKSFADKLPDRNSKQWAATKGLRVLVGPLQTCQRQKVDNKRADDKPADDKRTDTAHPDVAWCPGLEVAENG